MSVWTLEKMMDSRMRELEEQVRVLNRHMAKISESLEWIAGCHYQEFLPTTRSTNSPALKGSGEWDD